jgi:hypothetical protein
MALRDGSQSVEKIFAIVKQQRKRLAREWTVGGTRKILAGDSVKFVQEGSNNIFRRLSVPFL